MLRISTSLFRLIKWLNAKFQFYAENISMNFLIDEALIYIPS